MDGWSLSSASGLVALRAEEGEGEVDALDLTDSAFDLGLRPALQEVGFEIGGVCTVNGPSLPSRHSRGQQPDPVEVLEPLHVHVHGLP
jgi:hypothetical protein